MTEMSLLIGAVIRQAITDYLKATEEEAEEIRQYLREDVGAQFWFDSQGVNSEVLIEKLDDMRKR